MNEQLRKKLEQLKKATPSDFDKPDPSASVSLPILTWFNSAALHTGTLIKNGGWGIEKTETFMPPDIGPIQKIVHLGGGHSMRAVTNKPLRMVILGMSPLYTRWFVSGKDKPPKYMDTEFFFKRLDKQVAQQHNNPDLAKAESGVSVFVALDKDPTRAIYEIPVKTFLVDDWIRLVSLIKLRTGAMHQYFIENFEGWDKNYQWPVYSQWVEIGVGGESLEGGNQKSAVTHPEMKWPGVDLPLEELWTNHANRRGDGKPMICDGMAQWSYLKDKFDMQGLVNDIPDDEDQALFDAQRIKIEEMMKKGFRKPLPGTPDGIRAALEGSRLLQLSGGVSSGQPDGDGVIGDVAGDPAGNIIGSVAANCQVDPNFSTAFFKRVINETKVVPPKAMAIWDITNLSQLQLSPDEAIDALRLATAASANPQPTP